MFPGHPTAASNRTSAAGREAASPLNGTRGQPPQTPDGPGTRPAVTGGNPPPEGFSARRLPAPHGPSPRPHLPPFSFWFCSSVFLFASARPRPPQQDPPYRPRAATPHPAPEAVAAGPGARCASGAVVPGAEGLERGGDRAVAQACASRAGSLLSWDKKKKLKTKPVRIGRGGSGRCWVGHGERAQASSSAGGVSHGEISCSLPENARSQPFIRVGLSRGVSALSDSASCGHGTVCVTPTGLVAYCAAGGLTQGPRATLQPLLDSAKRGL